jgi:hypothetical protein
MREGPDELSVSERNNQNGVLGNAVSDPHQAANYDQLLPIWRCALLREVLSSLMQTPLSCSLR